MVDHSCCRAEAERWQAAARARWLPPAGGGAAKFRSGALLRRILFILSIDSNCFRLFLCFPINKSSFQCLFLLFPIFHAVAND